MQFYEQLFGESMAVYKKQVSSIYPCDQFVVDIDADSDDDDNDDVVCEEIKVVDVGCEEVKVDVVDTEITTFIHNEMEKWMLELYSDWYHLNYFGTLEHPIVLNDDKGELLRAINYYNCKAMSMVEMKVIMYGEQVENVKQMLTTLGFQFDKVDMTQFGIETTQAVGSAEVPYNLYDDDGDMYYVYNCYTTKEDDKMYEFRIVFDSSQLSVVKQSLKAGGFVVF